MTDLSGPLHQCPIQGCEQKFYTLQDLERHRVLSHVFRIKATPDIPGREF